MILFLAIRPASYKAYALLSGSESFSKLHEAWILRKQFGQHIGNEVHQAVTDHIGDQITTP